MKKKVLSVALVVALLAVMVGGTLAYFTDEDKVTNTFTIGSVKIDIYENDVATEADTSPMGKLTPVVNATPSEDDSYIDKVVKVKNTGANEAYIRVHIAQPVALLGYLELELETAGWKRVSTSYATVDEQKYIVVTYDYLTAVEPGDFTSELLKGAYLASDVDLKENADGNLEFCKPDGKGGYTFSGFVAHASNGDGTYTSNEVKVLIAAEAIQADGFDSATNALNAGFGEKTNPWQS